MTETSIKANRLWNVVQSWVSRLSSATIFVVSIYYLLLSVDWKVTSLHLEIIFLAFHFMMPQEKLVEIAITTELKVLAVRIPSGCN